ncbi:actin cytoskeleton organization protein [Cristinia sonorae]|uniref:Actin cytoskeleton organization protein n=1 Tax=Cristinia sonorae TaxID=1940300 RepID=A0A8K0UYD9_9AGAR|nr:actin cytoskeleton organization protein [Cristinia sonorae]
MSAAFDRQIRPVYDALDTNSNKSAVLACNKLLKKYPTNILVKALKALALVRQQKVEESLVLCDEVLAVKPTDESVLAAMMHVLRNLGRQTDIIAMYDNAYKQQPHNEDLATHVFIANVRTGNWKAAQQVATKMHKQFQEDRYLFWSVFSAILQANDPNTPPALKPVLFKLAHRLVTTSSVPTYHSADRLYVHLLILRELEMYDEALALLDEDIGKAICDTSLTCDAMRRDIKKLKGLVKEEGETARLRILQKKDRNWLEFLSVLDATFWDVTSTSEPTEEARESCKKYIAQTHDMLQQLADLDGLKDRSAMLALLELEKRARQHGFSSGASRTLSLTEKYFMHFGDKACCVEDLVPYIDFESEYLEQWTAFLETHKSFATATDLQRGINVLKLVRYNLSESELTTDLESARAVEYATTYLNCLEYGKNLPDTELQPADDIAILAGQTFVSAWKSSQDESHLHNAVSILEYASARSKQSYRIRLLLIRIYQLLGAPSLALEHYRLMNVKQVQTDTLSHLVLSRAATYSLSALGDITYMSECMESSQIYMSNSQETAEFIARAFQMEKYTQISEFIEFEDRLDNSLQRDLMKVEHVRMRLTHEPINADLVDMELIELKFIFDRLHHDNRDFEVIPNYQPKSSLSFNEQTMPFNKVLGPGWLSAFLKIYIKVFQQASDLDDSVEDKLLIGDRPKPSNDPENQLLLNERLAKRRPEEAEELTPTEKAFYEYATALSNWLAPYHDYVRPPPSALLAEAAKVHELKPGHSLKALAPPAGLTNGNGNAKKDEEPPAVTEPPEIISKFFDDMKAQFQAVLDGSQLPPELLHIATITQEAFIVFAAETVRFKPAAVVKVNKFGGLVQSFKDVRTKASDVLRDISTHLQQLAEQTATPETRKLFVESSKSIQSSSGFDHDYVLGVAKKITDARKEIYEGIGKGIVKVLKAHS